MIIVPPVHTDPSLTLGVTKNGEPDESQNGDEKTQPELDGDVPVRQQGERSEDQLRKKEAVLRLLLKEIRQRGSVRGELVDQRRKVPLIPERDIGPADRDEDGGGERRNRRDP